MSTESRLPARKSASYLGRHLSGVDTPQAKADKYLHSYWQDMAKADAGYQEALNQTLAGLGGATSYDRMKDFGPLAHYLEPFAIAGAFWSRVSQTLLTVATGLEIPYITGASTSSASTGADGKIRRARASMPGVVSVSNNVEEPPMAEPAPRAQSERRHVLPLRRLDGR